MFCVSQVRNFSLIFPSVLYPLRECDAKRVLFWHGAKGYVFPTPVFFYNNSSGLYLFRECSAKKLVKLKVKFLGGIVSSAIWNHVCLFAFNQTRCGKCAAMIGDKRRQNDHHHCYHYYRMVRASLPVGRAPRAIRAVSAIGGGSDGINHMFFCFFLHIQTKRAAPRKKMSMKTTLPGYRLGQKAP